MSPLAGWICPAGTPTAGRRNVGCEHCVTACQHPCVSAPLLIAMFEAERRNYHKGAYLSATTLTSTDCARRVWLERMTPFFDTPRRRFWAFRGTSWHAMIEQAGTAAAQHSWIQELRLSVALRYEDLPAPVFDDSGRWTGEFDDRRCLEIQVSGTTDGYRLYPEPELHDFKTMGDLKLLSFVAGEEGGEYSRQIRTSWIQQVNIYSFLVARTPVAAVRERLQRLGIPIPETVFLPKPKRLRIQAISMMDLVLTGSRHVPLRSREAFEMEEVPMLDDAEVEAFIRERAVSWYRYLALGIKPPVVPDTQSRLCRFCPFYGSSCFPEAERGANT